MRAARVILRVFSFHFNRTDAETVVHSDSGFAAVSYLRIKGATIEEKQESGGNLTVPPLLDADFARIRTLLLEHHPADASAHVVPEPVPCWTTVRSRGMSTSQTGNWMAVGNVYIKSGQGITFEEEVSHCFRDLQGTFTSVDEALF